MNVLQKMFNPKWLVVDPRKVQVIKSGENSQVWKKYLKLSLVGMSHGTDTIQHNNKQVNKK